MHEQQAQARVAVQRTRDDQALGRDRGLELISDRVLEVVALEPGVGVVVGGMQHQRHVELFGGGPKGLQPRPVQRGAGDGGADVRADRATGGGRPEQLGGAVRLLERHVREPAKPALIVSAQLGQAGVHRQA
jgi:hypothetical protein